MSSNPSKSTSAGFASPSFETASTSSVPSNSPKSSPSSSSIGKSSSASKRILGSRGSFFGGSPIEGLPLPAAFDTGFVATPRIVDGCGSVESSVKVSI